MKQILVFHLFLCFCLSTQALEESYSLKCVWQESEKHSENYFVEGASFEISFYHELTGGPLTKALISSDSFFNRTYTPCWIKPEVNSSCMFAYSYDANSYWDVDDKLDVISQSWRQSFKTDYNDGLPEEEGTVDGLSTLKFDLSSEDGAVVLSGDDGDGVTFTETFKCKLIN